MIEVRQTRVFADWLDALRGRQARLRIQRRIDRLELGNFGDVKGVGLSVSELRVDHGPGFRVYFTRRGARIVILLCGGDKSSQKRDIATAIQMAGIIGDDV